jgi:hypothetical protein
MTTSLPPRPRTVVLDLRDTPRDPRLGPPIGQGDRGIDQPIVISPAVEALTRKQRRRVKAALRVLDHVRARAERSPTWRNLVEFKAIHELVRDAGYILGPPIPGDDGQDDGQDDGLEGGGK